MWWKTQKNSKRSFPKVEKSKKTTFETSQELAVKLALFSRLYLRKGGNCVSTIRKETLEAKTENQDAALRMLSPCVTKF